MPTRDKHRLDSPTLRATGFRAICYPNRSIEYSYSCYFGPAMPDLAALKELCARDRTYVTITAWTDDSGTWANRHIHSNSDSGWRVWIDGEFGGAGHVVADTELAQTPTLSICWDDDADLSGPLSTQCSIDVVGNQLPDIEAAARRAARSCGFRPRSTITYASTVSEYEALIGEPALEVAGGRRGLCGSGPAGRVIWVAPAEHLEFLETLTHELAHAVLPLRIDHTVEWLDIHIETLEATTTVAHAAEVRQLCSDQYLSGEPDPEPVASHQPGRPSMSGMEPSEAARVVAAVAETPRQP